jgi:hypothetical protein
VSSSWERKSVIDRAIEVQDLVKHFPIKLSWEKVVVEKLLRED